MKKSLALLLGVSVITTGLFAETSKLPSIADEVKTYQEKGKNAAKKGGGKSPFSTKDMQAMQLFAKELAKKMPNPGLKVGDKAPDFSLKNAFGKEVRLYDEIKKGPVILTFYRGAWCPFCNLELHALNTSLPAFKKYNASVIAVTPQKPDKSAAQIKKDAYPFEILSDLDSKVIKNYKLLFKLSPELVAIYKKAGLNLEDFNGKGRNELPVPGTFVIDTKGVIRAAFADTDYKKRMEPVDIVKALKTIK